MRYCRVLTLCGLLALFVLFAGCAVLPLDTAGVEAEPLPDKEYFAQLAAYAGHTVDWSEELHDVALQALQDASGSLDMEALETLMQERNLVYETLAAASVKTDVWPPRYHDDALRDGLVRGFAEGHWQGALASLKTEDGGALLLVTADMADPAAGQLREAAKKIWQLTNAYRREHGIPTLEWDSTAARIAQAKTEEMHEHGYFDHISPVTGDLAAQFLAFGGLTWEKDIRAMGENIAMAEGYQGDCGDASYWMDLWIASPEHRDNMLNENYTRMGAAIYQGENGQSYAAQEFLTYLWE
jgi:uncharacterized protein YkwD